MKADDRFMMMLTALVLVVGLGTMAQKSDMIMAAFGSVDAYEGVEDAYAVRAGSPQRLDVLANDLNVAEGDADRILIVKPPVCGTLRRSDGAIEYVESAACGGRVTFTYCVIQGEACPSARVTLTVAPPEALPQRDSMAVASAEIAPTLEAPSLSSPDTDTSLPAESVATLRSRPGAPSVGGLPSMTAGANIGRQQSARPSAGEFATAGLSAPTVLETSRPSLGDVTAGARIGGLRTSAPQLGATTSFETPSVPTSVTALQTANRRVAPSPFSAPSSQPSGFASPSFGGGSLEQPTVTASRSPSISASSSRPQIGRSAPSVGLSRPAAGAGDTPVAVSNPTARPIIVAQSSTSRPRVQSPGASFSASNPIVTERAAQVIVPATLPTSTRIGTGGANAPSIPSAQAILSLPSVPSLGSSGSGSRASAEPEIEVAALSTDVPETVDRPAVEVVEAPATCNVNMIASEKLGEVLALTLTSACRPDSLVTFEHAGVSFTERTDDAGKLQIDLPALNERAVVTAKFEDGAEGEVSATIRGISRSSRVAISWSGDADLDLHAFEFGSAEGTEGHIWEAEPRSYRDSRRSGGGYMTTLGLTGYAQAEIYTLPITRRTKDGVIDLEIRAAAGATACGADVDMVAVQNDQALTAEERDFGIAVAACGDQTTELTYPTLLRDITIAQR